MSDWARRESGSEATKRQAEILDATGYRVMRCCSRQWGTTTLAALRAVHDGWYHAGALVVVG